MSRRRVVALGALGVCGALSLLAPTPGRAEPAAPTPIERVVGAVGPCVVRLEGTAEVRITMGERSQSQRVPGKAVGTLLDPTGLVLVSDSEIGGPNSPQVEMIRSMLPGLKIEIEMAELRVRVGDGSEELPATLVVRDSRNDLAWVQILDLGERRLPAVDLAAGRDPLVGERVVSVTRMDAGFGFAPRLTLGSVASALTLPRKMWRLGIDDDLAGLLHFDLEGRPVGVLGYVTAPAGVSEGDVVAAETRLLPMDVLRRSLREALKRVPAVLEAHAAAKPPSEPAPVAPPEPPAPPAQPVPAPEPVPPQR